MESTYFIFDGVNSRDMDVVLGAPSRGLFKEKITSNIRVEQTKGNSGMYAINSVDREPFVFEFSIFIRGWSHSERMRDIIRWLTIRDEEYKTLSFDANPNKVFYATLQNAIELTHNGAFEGYMSLSFITDSPYAYSAETDKMNYICKGRKHLLLYNDGDVDLYPVAKIKHTGARGSGITIKNKTTGKSFTLNNLQNNEILQIDFLHKEIVSDMEYLGVYRYDNFKGDWFYLGLGFYGDQANEIELIGDFTLELELQYVYNTYY